MLESDLSAAPATVQQGRAYDGSARCICYGCTVEKSDKLMTDMARPPRFANGIAAMCHAQSDIRLLGLWANSGYFDNRLSTQNIILDKSCSCFMDNPLGELLPVCHLCRNQNAIL